MNDLTPFDDLIDAIHEAEFIAKHEGVRCAIVYHGGAYRVPPVWVARKAKAQILEVVRPSHKLKNTFFKRAKREEKSVPKFTLTLWRQ
jgi:hypothetical protein